MDLPDLSDAQMSLLEMTKDLNDDEMLDLKKLIIAFKAQRLALLADKVWIEKGWTQETMQQLLGTHLRKK